MLKQIVIRRWSHSKFRISWSTWQEHVTDCRDLVRIKVSVIARFRKARIASSFNSWAKCVLVAKRKKRLANNQSTQSLTLVYRIWCEHILNLRAVTSMFNKKWARVEFAKTRKYLKLWLEPNAEACAQRSDQRDCNLNG